MDKYELTENDIIEHVLNVQSNDPIIEAWIVSLTRSYLNTKVDINNDRRDEKASKEADDLISILAKESLGLMSNTNEDYIVIEG